MSDHDTTNPEGMDWLSGMTVADTIAVKEDAVNGIAVIQVGHAVGNQVIHVVTLAVPLHVAQAWGGSLLTLNRNPPW